MQKKMQKVECKRFRKTENQKYRPVSTAGGRIKKTKAIYTFLILVSLFFTLISPAGAVVVSNNDADPVTGAGGTVTDLDTGFVWMKDANCINSHYPGADPGILPPRPWPPGPPPQPTGVGDGKVTVTEARAFVTGMNNGDFPLCSSGHTDWRLPTALYEDGTLCGGWSFVGSRCDGTEFEPARAPTELRHLFEEDGIRWTIDGAFAGAFSNLKLTYWTSTVPTWMGGNPANYGIYFRFFDGIFTASPLADNNIQTSFQHVLALRGPFVLPVAGNDSGATDEGTPVTINVSANDTPVPTSFPLDLASIEIITPPAAGSAVANMDGTITYTPALGFTGDKTFSYLIRDTSDLPSNLATVTVTVTSLNASPVSADDAYSTAEDSPLTIAAPGVLSNDTDADGDPLTASVLIAPGNGTLNMAPGGDGGFTYTPAPDFNGMDNFSYFANDGTSNGNTATVTLNVTGVNDAPVAANDAVTMAEDTSVNIGVTANDTDVDADVLTVTAAGPTANGTVSVNASGISVDYTPNADFNGSDSFSYTVSDGNGGTAAATVTITVTPVNDSPVATDDNDGTNEDATVNIDVAANDSDTDGDALTVIGTGPASNGTASVSGGTNTVDYTPNADFNGTDSFTYTVSDGNGGEATATVTVTVTAVNDAPVAGDDVATTPEDTVINVDVLPNDSDIDGDALSVSGVGPATNGVTAVNSAASSVTYTPNADFNGSDSFSYTISDGNGGEATANVSVTINAVNDPPVAGGDTATTFEDAAVDIDVVLNDSDIDGDALSVTGVGPATNGVTSVNAATNTVTYTPVVNFSGADSFSYTISDGNGATATGTVTVTVTPVNDLPVAGDDTGSTDEDTAVNVDVVANDSDIDGDILRVAGAGPATNGVTSVNTATNSVTYTPNANFNGSDSFSYTVSDGNGGSASANVSVTVNAVNDPPAAADDTATTGEDTTVNVDVVPNDSDIDGDAVTVIAVGNPANGAASVNGGTNTVDYTPNANFTGSDSFSYTVSDGNGATATGTVTVTVTPVNDLPVASDDTVSTDEDTAVNVDVVANDSDIDGDTLSVAGVGPATSGVTSVNTATNSVTYTPNANFNGSDSFSYTVSDGNGGSASANVSVTVNAVNDPPAAADDAATTDEDIVVNIAVAVNDTDLDGDPLTVTGVGVPSNGTASVNAATNTVDYTPNADFNGSDSFTYTISDGNGATATGAVTVTVNPVNDDPVAGDDTANTAEDTAVNVAVLPNDSDIDGDTLTVTGVGPASNGVTLLNTGTNSVTYTPNANFIGSDSFTYTISDGNGGSATANVSVTVRAANDPPVAVDDTATTAEDAAVNIHVVANDTDLDGDPLLVTGVGVPSNGTASVDAATNTVDYTPNVNFNGSDSFTYTISDGNGATATASVFVTVHAVNDPPVSADDTAATGEDTAVHVDVVANDSDIDGDILRVAGAGPATNGVASVNTATNSVTYTPNANFNGSDSFSYTVSDGNGATATGTVTVTVTPVNDLPVAADDAKTTQEDTAVNVDVLPNDSDIDGDTLTVSGVGAAANGTASVNTATNTVDYTPNANFSGTDVFSYTISDGNGGTATAAVAIGIGAVNDPPLPTAGAITTDAGVPGTSQVTHGDVDAGDTHTYAISTGPANGTASVNQGGLVTYSSATAGTDSIQVTVTDAAGATGTVTIAVTVNAAPPAGGTVDNVLLTPANGSAPVNAVQTMTVNALNTTGQILQTMKVEYFIPAGLTLSNLIATPAAAKAKIDPGKGRVKLQWDNVAPGVMLNATFDAGSAQMGSYTLTVRRIEYRDQNGQKIPGAGNSATLNVTSAPGVNNPPIPAAPSLVTTLGVPGTSQVAHGDFDAGDTHTYVISTPPGTGTATMSATGLVTYSSTVAGTDSLVVTVTDDTGATGTVTIHIIVTAAPSGGGTVENVLLAPSTPVMQVNTVQAMTISALNTTGQMLQAMVVEYFIPAGLDLTNLVTTPLAAKAKIDPQKGRMKLQWDNVAPGADLNAAFGASSTVPGTYTLTVRKVEYDDQFGNTIPSSANTSTITVTP